MVAALLPVGHEAAAGPGASATSQPSGPSGDAPVMLVMDTSGSMGDPDGSATGRIKIEGARSAMLNFVEGLPQETTIGLRTYPDDGGSGCEVSPDATYEPEKRDVELISAEIRSIGAGGDTPTPGALEAAAQDLRDGNYRDGTLVLVSDGRSTCGDPCPTARAIAASGLQLSVITVGFQISEEGAEELRCIADATGGRYLDADDSEALDEVLVDLTRPKLELAVNDPGTVVADVGLGQGAVDITATITNVGKVPASNIKAQLRFDDITTAPGVVSPVRVLGNLEPGAHGLTTTWRFQTGPLLAGKTVRYSVIVRAPDLLADLVEERSVPVGDVQQRTDAGDLLSGADRLVIMGDSYSSGEGARTYLPGTDTDQNSCHRSDQTYLVEKFDVADQDILACSGAITDHIWATPQQGKGAETQLAALEKRQRSGDPIDGVVLTIGGNDLGFSTIVLSCLASPISCNKRVVTKPSDRFLAEGLADLRPKLEETYRRINDIVNSKEQVDRRGGFAPILVLAYPRIVPGSFRPCPTFRYEGRDLINAGEVAFFQRVVTGLNQTVEQAAREARRSKRLPVLYVGTTEDAFLPDHTVCDRERFANSTRDLQVGADLARAIIVGRPLAGFLREVQELLHPNADGYDAETLAIIRASLTDEAQALAHRLGDAGAFETGSGEAFGGGWSSQVITDRADLASVQAGTRYRVDLDGYLPGSPVLLRVASSPTTVAAPVADAHGSVSAWITTPTDLAPGTHHVIAEGVDDALEPRVTRVAVTVEQPGPPLLWPALAIGSIVLMVVGASLRRRGRQLQRAAEQEVAEPLWRPREADPAAIAAPP